jgi:hypothetical protein
MRIRMDSPGIACTLCASCKQGNIFGGQHGIFSRLLLSQCRLTESAQKKHAHVFGGGKKSSSNIMKLVEKRKKILLASVSVCCGVKMESRSVECVHRKTHPSRRINDRIDVFRWNFHFQKFFFDTQKKKKRIHLYREGPGGAVPRAHDSLVTSIIHMYKIKKERGEALVCWDSSRHDWHTTLCSSPLYFHLSAVLTWITQSESRLQLQPATWT